LNKERIKRQRIMNFPNIFSSPLRHKNYLKGLVATMLTITSIYFLHKNFYQKNAYAQKNIEEKEIQKLEESLKHIMIRCYGIYTLIGSKPITQLSVLDPGFINFNEMSEEQIRERYEQLPDAAKELTSFEEFKDQPSLDYDQKELWDFWYKRWKNYTGRKYLFYEIDDYIELNGEKKRSLEGVFVNVLETAYILKKHYEEFKEVVGRDFDPLEVVYELPNRSESEFWRKIKGNFFSGLLFGFGEKNAFLFQLRADGKIPFHGNFLFEDFLETKKKAHMLHLHTRSLSIEDLSIPDYISFSPTDPIRLRYKQEREEILKIYSKKNFLNKTLLFLNSESFQPDVIKNSDIRS